MFGDLEVAPDAGTVARARARDRRVVMRKAWRNGMSIVLVGCALFAFAVALMVRMQMPANPSGIDLPQAMASALIVGGFVIVFLTNVVSAFVAFRSGFLHGLLAFLVPLYTLVLFRRQGIYLTIFGAWSVGLLAVAIGTLLLS